MNIDYEEIQSFKRMNLAEIIQSYGHELKKQAEGYITLCPFHEDTTPSLSINQKGEIWLWHCFGCRKGGTVIDFIMKKEGLTLGETYKKLREISGYNQESSQSKNQNQEKQPNQRDYKLLNEVFNYYENTFKSNGKAREYLKTRGINNAEIYERFRIGYADGSLPGQREIIAGLKQMGILTEEEYEAYKGYVILPIEDLEGELRGLYGRRLINKDRYDHKYLKGSHEGVFNARAFRVSKRIYLTECIIDALSLYEAGIREAVSLFGAGGVTEDHIRYMKETRTEEIMLCLDNDETGRKHTEKMSKRFREELGIKCWKLEIPEGIKDINEWLLKGMVKEDVRGRIKNLIASAAGICQVRTKETAVENSNKSAETILEKGSDITFSLGEGRMYRVRALDFDRVGVLKVNIKVISEEGSHLDTLDLNISSQREKFIKMTSNLLRIEKRDIRQDISKIIDRLEQAQSKYLENKERVRVKGKEDLIMTEKDKAEAIEALKSRDIMSDIISDLHECGYMGEDDNLLIGYLTASSRKLSNPLSLIVISRSAAGKTSLQDAILEFMPEEDVVRYTRLTDQSLFYHEEDSLYKKVLAIEEEAGASGTGYALRNVLTSKYLRTGSTIKDPLTGRLTNQRSQVRVRTSVFLTTTKQSLDYETMNRFIVAAIDESEEQTRDILEYQRRLYGAHGHELRKRRAHIIRKHRNMQRMIEEIDIVNPYERELTFTTKTLRARREQIKYLNIINAVALIRQHQKPLKKRADKSGYIEVGIEDIRIANRLAKIYLTRSLDYLSPPSRNLYEEIREMVKGIKKREDKETDNIRLSRREIMDKTGWSEWQVRTHIRELVELEYLIETGGRQGKRYGYKLAEPVEFELPEVELEIRDPEERDSLQRKTAQDSMREADLCSLSVRT